MELDRLAKQRGKDDRWKVVIMYIEATDGTKYPTNSVIAIRKPRDVVFTSASSDRKGRIQEVVLSSGDTVDVHTNRVEELLRQPSTAFAAASGTYVLNRDSNETFKTPVIGWSSSLDGAVYPITMNGVNHDLDVSLAVLLPSGEITGYDIEFATLEEWEEDHDSRTRSRP